MPGVLRQEVPVMGDVLQLLVMVMVVMAVVAVMAFVRGGVVGVRFGRGGLVGRGSGMGLLVRCRTMLVMVVHFTLRSAPRNANSP